MPGQRSRGARRARGSWLPRLAGMGVVTLLAAAGIIVYLATTKPSGSGPRTHLPTRVVAVQTIGLVATGPPTVTGPAGSQTLLASRAGLVFSPVPRSRLVTGNPKWTADLMAGATYVFIYSPSGQCLGAADSGPAGSGSATPRHVQRLVLEKCNLGASQRWRPVHPALTIAGHAYQQYASLSSGSCISVGAPRPAAGPGQNAAVLARCAVSRSWRQLISFWWGAGI